MSLLMASWWIWLSHDLTSWWDYPVGLRGDVNGSTHTARGHGKMQHLVGLTHLATVHLTSRIILHLLQCEWVNVVNGEEITYSAHTQNNYVHATSREYKLFTLIVFEKLDEMFRTYVTLLGVNFYSGLSHIHTLCVIPAFLEIAFFLVNILRYEQSKVCRVIIFVCRNLISVINNVGKLCNK